MATAPLLTGLVLALFGPIIIAAAAARRERSAFSPFAELVSHLALPGLALTVLAIDVL